MALLSLLRPSSKALPFWPLRARPGEPADWACRSRVFPGLPMVFVCCLFKVIASDMFVVEKSIAVGKYEVQPHLRFGSHMHLLLSFLAFFPSTATARLSGRSCCVGFMVSMVQRRFMVDMMKKPKKASEGWECEVRGWTPF